MSGVPNRESAQPAPSSERGQAAVELLAGVPALALAALVALQLLITGYAMHLADGAAEAGALALAGGVPAGPAARDALPGWARERVRVEADGGAVSVHVRPPAPLTAVSRALEVGSTAWVRPADG